MGLILGSSCLGPAPDAGQCDHMLTPTQDCPITCAGVCCPHPRSRSVETWLWPSAGRGSSQRSSVCQPSPPSSAWNESRWELCPEGRSGQVGRQWQCLGWSLLALPLPTWRIQGSLSRRKSPMTIPQTAGRRKLPQEAATTPWRGVRERQGEGGCFPWGSPGTPPC